MTQRGRIPPGPDDDDDGWMAMFQSLPDAEIDALLAGQPSASTRGGLSELVDALRGAAALHRAPVMSEALRLQIDRGAPRPISSHRRVLVGALSGLLFGGTAIGVAGAQELLPAPAQDAASSVADVLGIDLPRSSERDANRGGQGHKGGVGEDGTSGADHPDGPNAANPGATDATRGKSDTGHGPPATTPGGAVPADPGAPGDRQPATPAIPAPGQGQGNGNNASEIGQDSGGRTN